MTRQELMWQQDQKKISDANSGIPGYRELGKDSTYAKQELDLQSYEQQLGKLLGEQKAAKKATPGSAGYLTGTGSIGSAPYGAAATKPTAEVKKSAALTREIGARQQYLNQARYLQDKAKLADVTGSADFDTYSADRRGTESLLQRWDQKKVAPGQGGYLIGGVNASAAPYAAAQQDTAAPSYSLYNEADYMTGEEAAIYNYYYAKYGEEKAEEYLYSIREELNRRVAEERFARIEGKTAPELGFGVAAGLDQFVSGAVNLGESLTEDKRYIPLSPTQMVSGMVREDLSDAGPNLPEWMGGASLGQAGYDLITTTANMAPSILASMAVSLVNPAAGVALGNSLMGASAAGGAYQEALNDGYSPEQARGYGLLVGASEIALEKVLGGISAFGGNALGKTAIRNLDNASTALKRIARVAGSAVSEFSEEYLQEILTPFFRNIALGTGEEVKLFSEEALYSGILGALSGGTMETVGIAADAGAENRYYKDTYGSSAAELVQEGLESPEGSLGRTLAQKYREKLNNGGTLTGAQLRRLVEANERQFAAENAQTGDQATVDTSADNAEPGDIPAKTGTFAQRAAGELNRQSTETGEQAVPQAGDVGMAQPVDSGAEATVSKEEKVVSETENTTAQTTAASEAAVDAQKEGKAAENAAESPATGTEADGAQATGKKILQAAEESLEAPKPDNAAALEEASRKYGAQAKAMVSTYQQGQDVEKFDRAYQLAYDMGRSGVQESYAMNSEGASYLTESQRSIAFQTGKYAAAVAAGTAAEKNRAAAKGGTVRRKGTVKGEGVTIADLKKTFNDPQGRAYRYLSTVAEITGIDIVLYRSGTDAEGSFQGEQGKFKWSDDKIYIDVNAGLVKAEDAGELARYAMLRTFAHEFTHFIEKWNPVQYNEFRSVVFRELTARGENVHDLIEAKQAENEGMTYDTAGREVVAEAMTDILPDVNFVQELARSHKTIFQKLVDKLKEFADNLRSYYRSLNPNRSREANALKEQVGDTVRYVDSIVKLFDNVAVQAVENYQLTVTREEVAAAETESTTDTATRETVTGTKETVSETEETAIEAEKNVSEVEKAVGEGADSASGAESELTYAVDTPVADGASWGVPPKAETEEAKRELRKAVRMPIRGTNAEALLEGIRNKELSRDSITLSGGVEGFSSEQRQHLVEKLLEGVYTDREVIKIDVPYDGKFEISNTPGNVAKVLENLKVKVNQEVLFDKKIITLLTSNGDVRIVTMDGKKYLSNSYVLLPSTDAGVEYIKAEFKGREMPLHPEVEKALQRAEKPLTEAPTEAKSGKTNVLIFTADGQKLYFDKRLFAPLDGGKLFYTQLHGAGILKSVDESGNVLGYIMGIRPGENTRITDEKPSNIKSFAQRKSAGAANGSDKKAETAPADMEHIPKKEEPKQKPPKKPVSPKDTGTKAAKKTADKPATVETSVKLEDFGEKIGGARKDQWSKRGLMAEDLAEMNDRERASNVKKDNVWKRPDYRKLIEGGQDRNILFVRNEIRKALNQNINYPYAASEERKRHIQEEFVATVRAVQTMAEKVTTREDLAAMGRPWLMENGYRDERGFTDKWRRNPALRGTDYVQTIEHLVRNFDQLEKLADKVNFAVDAEKKIPAGYTILQDDRDSTWFIARGSWVVMNSIPSYEDAMEILRGAASSKKKKTRFVPQQLLEVHRKGPDYRGSRDVTGQDYLDTFGFKGGEFGNWMTEKDRRVSMNYGFDALKDLADALGVGDMDISLGGNLSIAFGARGQGLSGAAAHYENERRVINLTKMNGAGSLAHEWFHALDDFLGGYGSKFATEYGAKLPEATKAAVRHLLTTMQYRDATREETDMAATKSYEQAKRSVTYQVKNQFGWVDKLGKGTLTDADTRYFARKPTEADVKKYHELLDNLLETGDPGLVDALSTLRKEVNGRVIPKEDRDAISYRLYALKPAATENVQKMRLRSDFYENSRKFGELHQKDGDYWDSTIEMAARAFACYVADKTGKYNDYLSAHSDTAVTLTVDKEGKPVVVRAFPVGEERTRINGAFDQLFAALKEDGFLHQRGESAKPDMVQYQSREYLSDDAKIFRQEIESWDKNGRPEGESFVLGSTGSVLQGLGAIESDIYMQGDKINMIFKDHPEMGTKEIKNIPEILENPVMVLASRNVNRSSRQNTRLTIFGMVKAQNGLPVMVAFDLHPKENNLYLADMQKVVSAYTKDRTPTATLNLMQNSEVLYADKEKTAALLRSIGFQMPTDLLRNGYIGSISYSGTDVNIKGVPFSDMLQEYDEQHQQRAGTLSDREVLALAAEQLQLEELTEGERSALEIFQKRLGKLEDLQNQRKELGRQYREQQFGAKVDREEAAKTLNRMHTMDSRIQRSAAEVLSAEDKDVLRRVLQKARKVVEQQEREHGQEILKRWRDRKNNAADIRKYRDRLQKDVKELTDWILHPNNKDAVKHVPDTLKGSVIPLLSSIDFTSKSAQSGRDATKADREFLKRLEGLKAALKPDRNAEELYADYSDLPPNFTERLQSFIDSVRDLTRESSGEFIINRMTAAELKELSGLIRNLKAYIRQYNLFHVNAVYRHVYEAGDSTIQTLSEMGNASGRTDRVSDFVLWQQMRPAYAFERFGNGGKAIYDGLRRGQATLAFNTRSIQEFAEKTYTAEEVRSWDKQLKTIELEDGVVKMPVSTIMSFYELSKRPQALGHILGQGIRVATFKAGNQKISDIGHRITPEDVQTIIEQLTPRQKEVADKLQKYMQEQGGKWGNHVSVKRFGEELFGEEHYFPINSDGRFLSANADEKPGAASLYALLNMGFTKALTEKANNRIVLYSIFDVFANHMASMAQYNALALPVVDAIKWFNYQQKGEPDENGKREITGSVRDQMDRVYGVPEESRPGSGRQGYAQNFVINILKAFNGTEAQGTPADAIGVEALHRYNMAQVAFNLRVVVQQPLAISRAGLLIDYKSILRGMKLQPAAIQRNIREMQKYSGIAAWKALGFYDVNISRGLTDIIKHNEKPIDRINDFGMKGAELADNLTWAGIWSACKEEVIRKYKLIPKSEGFYEAVAGLFEDVIYKTQVVDSVLTKNAFLRSKGLFARTVGSFMSEPTTTASMLLNAYDKYYGDRQRGLTAQQAWKKNRKLIVRTAYVYGIGALLLAAAQAVADAWRDDDDYEEFGEKWLDAFGGNLLDELMPVNKLPILSDFYELAKELLAAIGVDTYGNPPRSVLMQWYDSLVKGVEILYGKITGDEDRYTWYGGAYKLLQAVSGISGLPMAAATREIVTAWNNTAGAMAPSLKVKTYDPGDRSSIRYAFQDGYLTEEEAAQLLAAYGGYTEEEAIQEAKAWVWEAEGIDASRTVVGDYMEFCEPVDIGRELYLDAYRFYRDSGEEGVSNSKVKECMPYINSLPLTAEQKTALALCWWAESTVEKYKLW